MSTVREFSAPPFDESEILRYARSRESDTQTVALMRSCIEEAESLLRYTVCYKESYVKIEGETCSLEGLSVRSISLAKNLDGCDRALILVATVGVGIDRLIARYSRISPSRALLLQAIGTERIEALCDSFCRNYEIDKGIILRSRFSAGYGDLPLECQKDIFSVLDCHRKIGVSLNDSMLMSPSKSVTAFAGISSKEIRR